MSEEGFPATAPVLQESYVESEAEGREETNLLEALNTHRDELRLAGSDRNTQGWLRGSLQTSTGTRQLYSALQQYVQKPVFLEKLTAARHTDISPHASLIDNTSDRQTSLSAPHNSNEWPSSTLSQDNDFTSVEGLVEGESFGSYVLVEKEDVIEAIGTFVAAYLATVPQAQNMKPADLQQALTSALKDLQKNRVQKVWAWGRCMYRCIAFSYGAFSVYENPWLVRAVVTALWAAGKVMLGILL